MNRCVPLVALALLVVATLPSAHAEPTPTRPITDKCAPPCGYIYPTIGMDADIKKADLRTSQIGALPATIPVAITYSWDMEQDGTGAPGDADPMKITIIVSKEPSWLSASLSPSTCEFVLVPVQNEYDVCTIDLNIEVDPTYVPTSEEDLDRVGKRLMLFATSEESGTFKKSYGVEDLRWTFDGAPQIEGRATAPAVEKEAAPGLAPAALVVGLAGLLGIARRRRVL